MRMKRGRMALAMALWVFAQGGAARAETLRYEIDPGSVVQFADCCSLLTLPALSGTMTIVLNEVAGTGVALVDFQVEPYQGSSIDCGPGGCTTNSVSSTTGLTGSVVTNAVGYTLVGSQLTFDSWLTGTVTFYGGVAEANTVFTDLSISPVQIPQDLYFFPSLSVEVGTQSTVQGTGMPYTTIGRVGDLVLEVTRAPAAAVPSASRMGLVALVVLLSLAAFWRCGGTRQHVGA